MLQHTSKPNHLDRMKANIEAAMDVICIVEDVVDCSVSIVTENKVTIFAISIYLQKTEGVLIHLNPVEIQRMNRKDLAHYLLKIFGWEKVEEYPL